MGFCVCSCLKGPPSIVIVALDGRGGAISFALIVYLLSCDFWCSTPLPRGAVSVILALHVPGHTQLF